MISDAVLVVRRGAFPPSLACFLLVTITLVARVDLLLYIYVL